MTSRAFPICVAFVLARTAAPALAAAANAIVIGRPYPGQPVLQWYNSPPLDRTAFEGRVVLIDYWATWCKPCVDRLPDLERMQRRFGDGLLVILLHDVETMEKPEKRGDRPEPVPATDILPQFLNEKRIKLPVAVSTSSFFRDLGVRGIPLYVLVDREGIVRSITAGRMPQETEIRRLVVEK
jgi:thiol-disulfide isomerase/thioredoxin